MQVAQQKPEGERREAKMKRRKRQMGRKMTNAEPENKSEQLNLDKERSFWKQREQNTSQPPARARKLFGQSECTLYAPPKVAAGMVTPLRLSRTSEPKFAEPASANLTEKHAKKAKLARNPARKRGGPSVVI
jgi:hypothetical protein